MSESHINSTVAQACFLQNRSINNLLEKGLALEKQRTREEVVSNRQILERIVNTTLYLVLQGMALREHKERLCDDSQNSGNVLELLKLLALYDKRTKGHLEQITRTQRNASTKGQRRSVARGRGAKLTFLSNRSQNKIIDIITEAIKEKLCDDIRHCMAWSLIADTTPDVSRKEQLSICVRIVHNDGRCTEHILSCVHALGTKAVNLFQLIKMTLQSCNITYEKLVGQAYDGASNMSGCYNGLQALIEQEVGE